MYGPIGNYKWTVWKCEGKKSCKKFESHFYLAYSWWHCVYPWGYAYPSLGIPALHSTDALRGLLTQCKYIQPIKLKIWIIDLSITLLSPVLSSHTLALSPVTTLFLFPLLSILSLFPSLISPLSVPCPFCQSTLLLSFSLPLFFSLSLFSTLPLSIPLSVSLPLHVLTAVFSTQVSSPR